MSTSKTIAWFIWLIASIFYAYQYVLRVMPNIMLKDIMSRFHIDAVIFGQFSGIYYIGYALMHLPIGIALDRYGPKKVMSACILLTVVGLLPIIFAGHWIYPVIGRLLIGIGSSAAILGTFKIIRMTFNERQFTRMLSFSVTIGLLGAIYGGGPVNYLCHMWGYAAVVKMFALLGLLLAIITYLIVPASIEKEPFSIVKGIKTVLTHPKVLLVSLSAGLMVGPLEGFADVWGSTFLKQVYSIHTTIASYLPSMIFIGMCFGGPLLSIIAEKTKAYLGVIMSAGFLMCIIFVALITKLFTVDMIAPAFILIGICCAYQILAIYKASTYVAEKMAGLTTAVANMIIMSFGYAFHSLIGGVVDFSGGIHLTHALINGVSVIPIALFMGSMGFFYLIFRTYIKHRNAV